MNEADRVKLLFGPYRAPPLKRGDRAFCLFRDCLVVVTSWTDSRAGRVSERPGYPGAKELEPTPPLSLATVPTDHAPVGVGDDNDRNFRRGPLLTPIIPEAPPVPLVVAFAEVDGVGFRPLDQAQLHGLILRPAEEAAQFRLRHADLNPLEIGPCGGPAGPQHEDHRDRGDRRGEQGHPRVGTKPTPGPTHGRYSHPPRRRVPDVNDGR